MAIRSFASRKTRRFAKGDTRRLPPARAAKIARLLKLLDRASSPQQLRLPGLRLHRLEPRHHGFFAVDVDNQLRLRFRFHDGNAYDVDIIDYHQN